VVANAQRGGGDQSLAWIAADLGVALLAQLAFFCFLSWFLRRPGWLRARRVWIPQIAAPPCVVRTASLWVAEVDPPNCCALLDPADCATRPLALVFSSTSYVTYSAGGHALQVATDPLTGRQTWWVIDIGSGTTLSVGVDQGQVPILWADGTSVTWLRPVAGTVPPLQFEAVSATSMATTRASFRSQRWRRRPPADSAARSRCRRARPGAWAERTLLAGHGRTRA
jgi:hypothetical protein